MEFVQGAMKLAEKFHLGQVYGGHTYIDGHLLPVMFQAKLIASGIGMTPLEVAVVEAAALLHDVIEDTECTRKEIEDIKGMPKQVADTVWTLTKDKHMTYACYMGFVAQGGIFPVIVKLADSMCNHRQCVSEGNLKLALRYCNNIQYFTHRLEKLVEEAEKERKGTGVE